MKHYIDPDGDPVYIDLSEVVTIEVVTDKDNSRKATAVGMSNGLHIIVTTSPQSVAKAVREAKGLI